MYKSLMEARHYELMQKLDEIIEEFGRSEYNDKKELDNIYRELCELRNEYYLWYDL